MSVILNALRSKRAPKVEKALSPTEEGLFWAHKDTAHRHPPSSKTIVVLAGILLSLALCAALVWFFKETIFKRRTVTPMAYVSNAPALPPPLDAAKKAKQLFQEGKLDESIEFYRKAVAKDPKNLALHNDFGLVLLKKERFEESEEQFKTALDLDGKCARCWNNLGYLKTLQGEALEAENSLKTAALLDAAFADPYFNLGVLYERNGDIGNAIGAYHEFLRRSREKNAPIFIQVQDHVHTLQVLLE